ncbi:hypothetical protein AWC38_SpisGene24262, partial [Stylophora pistillata]
AIGQQPVGGLAKRHIQQQRRIRKSESEEKKVFNKESAPPDEKKLKESCLKQPEATSFDMVSKSEPESVSSPLSKILARLRKLDSIDEAREALKKLKTIVDKLALDVATLLNKLIQEIKKGVKFLEDEANTHLKQIPTEEVSSLAKNLLKQEAKKPLRKESCKGKERKRENTKEMINSIMEEKLQIADAPRIALKWKSNTKPP